MQFLLLLPLLATAREIRLQDLKIPTRVMDEVEFVPLVKLVTTLGGNVWQVKDKLIAILPPEEGEGKGKGRDSSFSSTTSTSSSSSDSGYEIVFTQDQTRVLVNGQVLRLPVPFRFIDNEVYVPTAFLNEMFPVQLARMPRVLSLSLSSLRDTTVLRVELDTVAYYSSIAVTSTTFRIYLQAECTIKRMDPTGLIEQISFNQRNGAELMVGTTEPCVCRIEPEGHSLAIKFAPRTPHRIRTIVIDPGHGGQDPGASGKRLREKDVTLDIGLRLARRLKQLTRADIVLTRDHDVYVSLGDRTRMANNRQADVYVSLHCNSAPSNPSAQGFETYFLSAARDDWERAVMSRENASLEFPVPDTNRVQAETVGSILRDLAQSEYLKQSEELAEDIQASVTSWLRSKDRGVKQADFAVLRDAYMPAVLVECGFLTNPAEEKLLGAGDYRQRIANAISTGIMDFVQHVESSEGR
jgi:N-acetylmuramoyl-L-alanine amidase